MSFPGPFVKSARSARCFDFEGKSARLRNVVNPACFHICCSARETCYPTWTGIYRDGP